MFIICIVGLVPIHGMIVPGSATAIHEAATNVPGTAMTVPGSATSAPGSAPASPAPPTLTLQRLPLSRAGEIMVGGSTLVFSSATLLRIEVRLLRMTAERSRSCLREAVLVVQLRFRVGRRRLGRTVEIT